MLQLDNYMIDDTHTSYKRKNIIGQRVIHNIVNNNNKHGELQKQNKTRQENHK